MAFYNAGLFTATSFEDSPGARSNISERSKFCL